MTKMSKFKKSWDWLARNKKEILEFIITVLLLILTAEGIYLSRQANQITSYQTAIMELEHMPILEFKIGFVDDLSGYPADELLTISNEGYPLSGFDCQGLVFLYVQYHEKGEEPIIASIPLYDYYSASIRTSDRSGKLAILSSDIDGGNNKIAYQTIMDFYLTARERNASGSGEIKRYVKVSYDDIFDNHHEEVYLVNTLSGGQKLSETEGNKIVEDYGSKCRQNLSLDLSELSSESLYEKLLIS